MTWTSERVASCFHPLAGGHGGDARRAGSLGEDVVQGELGPDQQGQARKLDRKSVV